MPRQIPMQTDDAGGLGLKARIVRDHVPIRPLRLQGVLAPLPRHHHMADTQLVGQLARAPLRRAIRGYALHGPFEDPRFQRWRERARLLTRVTREQARQPLLDKSLAPAIDERVATVRLLANRRLGTARSEHQNQSRPACVIGTAGATVSSASQFQAFHIRQYDRACGHGHTPLFSCYSPLE